MHVHVCIHACMGEHVHEIQVSVHSCMCVAVLTVVYVAQQECRKSHLSPQCWYVNVHIYMIGHICYHAAVIGVLEFFEGESELKLLQYGPLNAL